LVEMTIKVDRNWDRNHPERTSGFLYSHSGWV